MKSKYILPAYPLYRIGEDGNLYSLPHTTIGRNYKGKQIKMQSGRFKLWLYRKWITPKEIEATKVLDPDPVELR